MTSADWFTGLVCPQCDTAIETCESAGPDQRQVPDDGDAHLCFDCAEFSIFLVAPDGTTTLRRANIIEAAVFEVRFASTLVRFRAVAPKRRR